MTHYHYGQNVPGYLPMADEPNTCRTFDEARDGLLEDMERGADVAYEEESDEEMTMAEAIDEAMQDVRGWDAGDNYTTAASSRPHDLGLAYWITACNEEECTRDRDDH